MTPETKEAVKHLRDFAKEMRAFIKGSSDPWARGYRQAAKDLDRALACIEDGRPEDMHYD
jgi:hypothetical protein